MRLIPVLLRTTFVNEIRFYRLWVLRFDTGHMMVKKMIFQSDFFNIIKDTDIIKLKVTIIRAQYCEVLVLLEFVQVYNGTVL